MAEVKKDEDWMQKKWRPAMGWMYMVVCFFDMVIFPILWALVQTIQHQQLVQWNPLTLQGAGLFHVAMGAVLGIAAFGRTQEKIAGSATNAPATTPPATTSFPPAMPAASSVPTPAAQPMASTSGFGSPSPAGFGAGFPGDPPTRNTRND
jgi:Holin of 3TMs, for gene-transfer release